MQPGDEDEELDEGKDEELDEGDDEELDEGEDDLHNLDPSHARAMLEREVCMDYLTLCVYSSLTVAQVCRVGHQCQYS
jgi:hypothetical protein